MKKSIIFLLLISLFTGCTSISKKPWQRNQENLLSGFGNMYNPHVIHESSEGYAYKMYFMGWAHTMCNPGYSGCDSIFLARSKSIEGPWKVYSGDNGWLSDDRIDLWVPVLAAGDKFYDQWHNGDPSVVKHNDKYYMAYSATGFDKDGINQHDPDPEVRAKDTDGFISVIMGATSNDGIHWNRSEYPILIYEPEIGKMETYEGEYKGNFHRPSLMWDRDHWRLWFDYWQPGENGMGMGHAECYSDPMNYKDWKITHDLDKALLIEWPNPDVIKVGRKYYSVADPKNYPLNKKHPWICRQIREAVSDDGISWKIQGWIHPDSDTPAMHVPEAFAECNNDQSYIYIFYACQIGGEPYDYQYDRMRFMRRPM